MWKITNKYNHEILRSFNRRLIKPFFEICIDLSKKLKNKQTSLNSRSQNIWRKSDYFLSSADSGLLDYVFAKRKKPHSINNLMYKMLFNHNTSKLKDFQLRYEFENDRINRGNYNFPSVNVPNELRIIFVNFFYEIFFSDEKVWGVLIGEDFNRSIFHRNLKDENSLIVCPYCDIDTTISTSNNFVEHFLPKSKYPFLALNPLNLVSSCNACNFASEGKGENIFQPIYSPYKKQIGDFVDFKVREGQRLIDISSKNKRVDNYLNTLKIKDKYRQERVFLLLKHYGESLFQTLQMVNHPSRSDVQEYLARREKMEPLSFALKALMKDFPEYEVKL